jgi:hypothetical protein
LSLRRGRDEDHRQFRDLDNPNKFVWLRGFRDMHERAQSLAAFYGGPVWQAHRQAANETMRANETMTDSDDMLLLRPARPGEAFTLDHERPPDNVSGGAVSDFAEATVMHLETAAAGSEIVSHFERAIAPAIRACGRSILGYFVTDPSRNTFPSLPIREGEPVFVWFAAVADRASLDHATSNQIDNGGTPAQAPGLRRTPQLLRLETTSRSLLHGRSPSCHAAALANQDPGREDTR